MMANMIDADALVGRLRELVGVSDGIPDFINNHVNSGLALAIRELEIERDKAIEFDAQGWCWDMSKAPKDRVLATDGKRIAVTRVENWDGKFVSSDHYNDLIAWRPLPAIPEVRT